jgi:hypothetical protein
MAIASTQSLLESKKERKLGDWSGAFSWQPQPTTVTVSYVELRSAVYHSILCTVEAIEDK